MYVGVVVSRSRSFVVSLFWFGVYGLTKGVLFMQVEVEDLNVELTLGLVCHGRMCDLVKIRDDIRTKYPGVKLQFNTVSSEYLFIVKKSNLTPEQKKIFEKGPIHQSGIESLHSQQKPSPFHSATCTNLRI